MKKSILIIFVAAICLIMMSFIWKPSNVNSERRTETTETLVNSEYGQTVTLYSNGYIAVKTSDGAGGGKYDIRNGYIYIEWENGAEQSGPVSSVVDANGRWRVRSIIIAGVTYSNTERFVVKRR